MQAYQPRSAAHLLLLGLLLSLVACKAREPGSLETAMARNIKQRITVGGKHKKNPLPTTEENIHAGRENFSHYCMVCHGLDGQNTGVPFAEKMSPCAFAELNRRPGLHRWATEVGDRQWDFSIRYARFQRYSH